MNAILRRAMPWTIALLLHAAVLLIPVRLGVISRARPEERRIDLVFDQPAPRTASPATRLPPREEVELPAGAAPVAPLSPAAAQLPRAISGSAASLDDRLVELSATGSSHYPSPQDVLADLPVAAPPAESAAFTATTEDPALAEVAAAAASIQWQGKPRSGIRRMNPEFPRVMSRTGQEGECVARITITPSGTVSRVEIVRSSGYPEIDASVAAALRGWLYARADGLTSVATISYPFRLRKLD